MKSVEIELKFKVDSVDNLISFLKQNGEFIGDKHQIDEYFTPVHRNFIKARPVKEWLRIRTQGNKYFITYKNWHFEQDGTSHYCDEYETEVEDIEQMRKVFSAIDIKPVATVDKKRQLWHYGDFEISIDSVANLGDFIEIEYKGEARENDPEHKGIRDEMITFLKEHDCGELKRNSQGYPFLLLFPDEVEYTTV